MDVFSEVKSIISEVLEVPSEEITPKASFKEDLEADSLDLVELLMAFEERFGAEIPDEDVKAINTVGDVVQYIEARLPE